MKARGLFQNGYQTALKHAIRLVRESQLLPSLALILVKIGETSYDVPRPNLLQILIKIFIK